MRRRHFISGSLALPLVMAVQGPVLAITAGGARRSLRVVLTGQSLLTNNFTDDQWPAAREFRSFFRGADAVFTNLETAIKGRYAQEGQRHDGYVVKADPSVIDRLASVGINMFATSNNHAYDLGPGGIRDAIEVLDARHLTHAGTGMDLAKAAAPGYRVTAKGVVALVAAASGNVLGMAAPNRPGVNELRRNSTGDLDESDVSRYLTSIKEAAAKAEIAIAYTHNHYTDDIDYDPNGPSNPKEMGKTPSLQRRLAHRAIDAGASLFVSHGWPVLEGIEIYKGKPIFYNLGGFFFPFRPKPGDYPEEIWQSVVVDCRCNKAGFDRISLTAVQLNDTGTSGFADKLRVGWPQLVRGAEGRKILARLARLSEEYGTRFTFTPHGAEIVIG